jgi:hypothetical protein
LGSYLSLANEITKNTAASSTIIIATTRIVVRDHYDVEGDLRDFERKIDAVEALENLICHPAIQPVGESPSALAKSELHLRSENDPQRF